MRTYAVHYASYALFSVLIACGLVKRKERMEKNWGFWIDEKQNSEVRRQEEEGRSPILDFGLGILD
jgi:hypothetical protein